MNMGVNQPHPLLQKPTYHSSFKRGPCCLHFCICSTSQSLPHGITHGFSAGNQVRGAFYINLPRKFPPFIEWCRAYTILRDRHSSYSMGSLLVSPSSYVTVRTQMKDALSFLSSLDAMETKYSGVITTFHSLSASPFIPQQQRLFQIGCLVTDFVKSQWEQHQAAILGPDACLR